MIDINNLNIKELHKLYNEKKVTVKEIVDLYLENIKTKNPDINAYLEVYNDIDDYVKIAQDKIDKAKLHFLTGVPVAIKDNMLFKRSSHCFGWFKMLENYVAPYTQ